MPRRRRSGLGAPRTKAELERQEATRALLSTLPVQLVERDGRTFRPSASNGAGACDSERDAALG
jgi:hypothetical protein